MIVVVTKELEQRWATDEELASMSDEEIIVLLREDLPALINNATWELHRDKEVTP